MNETLLLRIVIGELECGERNWRLLYSDIVKFLWEKGLSGATVVRATEGIGEKNDFRGMYIEDIHFNNLPIMIEAIDSACMISSIRNELQEKIPHGEMITMEVVNLKEGELAVNKDGYLMLKIYVKEDSNWRGNRVYEEALQVLKDHQFIWSTIIRGIEGFGRDHVIHKQSMFSFSSKVPVIIESIGTKEQIEKVLPVIKEKVQEGMVIAIPIDVYLDR